MRCLSCLWSPLPTDSFQMLPLPFPGRRRGQGGCLESEQCCGGPSPFPTQVKLELNFQYHLFTWGGIPYLPPTSTSQMQGRRDYRRENSVARVPRSRPKFGPAQTSATQTPDSGAEAARGSQCLGGCDGVRGLRLQKQPFPQPCQASPPPPPRSPTHARGSRAAAEAAVRRGLRVTRTARGPALRPREGAGPAPRIPSRAACVGAQRSPRPASLLPSPSFPRRPARPCRPRTAARAASSLRAPARGRAAEPEEPELARGRKGGGGVAGWRGGRRALADPPPPPRPRKPPCSSSKGSSGHSILFF